MRQEYNRSDSKVEVTGFEARHYAFFMNLITAGTYPFFIRSAVRQMRIQLMVLTSYKYWRWPV